MSQIVIFKCRRKSKGNRRCGRPPAPPPARCCAGAASPMHARPRTLTAGAPLARTHRATLADGTKRARTGMQAVAAALPARRSDDRKSNENRLAPAILIASQHLLRAPHALRAHSRRRGFV
ncbi:hypothetical protein [Burkholderia ubonensis]|uniref:hypothetical protein n=1 Tax=Burkholderia ubonensis TaxID=101571 RepID=UPI0012F8E6EE|nr:hypothetical protein [Burkholderia ubonensis]